VGAGRALNKLLADHPHKILALELGGNNPLVVWDAADVKAAALLTIQSAYQTTGQRCSCARRLIVEAGPRGDALVNRLLALIPKIRIGPYTDRPEPFMGPLVRRHACGPRTPTELRRLLVEVRRAGHATEEGFVTPGFASVAAPVLDHTGHPVAAVALTFGADDVDDDARLALAAEARRAADEVARRIHGRPAGTTARATGRA